MIDFLRANTWCSREEYLWNMTVPQVRLAATDFSHVDYNEKKAQRKHKNSKQHTSTKRTINNAEQLKNLTDFGAKIIK